MILTHCASFSCLFLDARCLAELFFGMWCIFVYHHHLTIIICCTVVWPQAWGLERKTSFVFIVHLWCMRCFSSLLWCWWWEQCHDNVCFWCRSFGFVVLNSSQCDDAKSTAQKIVGGSTGAVHGQASWMCLTFEQRASSHHWNCAENGRSAASSHPWSSDAKHQSSCNRLCWNDETKSASLGRPLTSRCHMWWRKLSKLWTTFSRSVCRTTQYGET